jgi:hypothetical protein
VSAPVEYTSHDVEDLLRNPVFLVFREYVMCERDRLAYETVSRRDISESEFRDLQGRFLAWTQVMVFLADLEAGKMIDEIRVDLKRAEEEDDDDGDERSDDF